MIDLMYIKSGKNAGLDLLYSLGIGDSKLFTLML